MLNVQAFASNLACKHYQYKLQQKVWAAWHSVVESRWQQRVEKACQTRAEQICIELTNDYETKLASVSISMLLHLESVVIINHFGGFTVVTRLFSGRGVARNLFWGYTSFLGGIKVLNSRSDVILPHKKFTWVDFGGINTNIHPRRYAPV